MTRASGFVDRAAGGAAGDGARAVAERGAPSARDRGLDDARRATGWHVRSFDPASDPAAIARLDTSYVSDRAYAVLRDGDVIALAPTVTVARVERAAVDPGDWATSDGRVVALDGTVCGAIAWAIDVERREMTIRQLHVDRAYRRRGAARALVDVAIAAARRAGVSAVRLNLSSVNAPAIAASRRLGFAICGFDAAQDARAVRSDGAVAVFLVRRVDGHDGRGDGHCDGHE